MTKQEIINILPQIYFDTTKFVGLHTADHEGDSAWLSANPPGSINNPLTFIGDLTPVTPPSPTDLTILSSTDVLKTGTTYTRTVPSSGTNWGGTILWEGVLQAGNNGYLEMDTNNSTAKLAMLGFKTTAVESGYGSGFTAIWVDFLSSNLSHIEAGSGPSISMVSYNPGSKIRISRQGSTLKVQQNTGGTITDLYTFLDTYSGNLYPVSDIREDGLILNPKGYNLTLS